MTSWHPGPREPGERDAPVTLSSSRPCAQTLPQDLGLPITTTKNLQAELRTLDLETEQPPRIVLVHVHSVVFDWKNNECTNEWLDISVTVQSRRWQMHDKYNDWYKVQVPWGGPSMEEESVHSSSPTSWSGSNQTCSLTPPDLAQRPAPVPKALRKPRRFRWWWTQAVAAGVPSHSHCPSQHRTGCTLGPCELWPHSLGPSP